MILWYCVLIVGELNEKGYLFSVGKEQFLSIEGEQIRTIPKSEMPKLFEIETRPGESSYMLRVYPSPRQGDKVLDKDWWYNDHKLILYGLNDWQSQHFIFSMLPKNMIKIVVKERCAEVKDDGTVKASLCKSHADNKFQYFRWIRESDRRIVQMFVRKHGGGRYNDYNDQDLGEDMFDGRRGGRGGMGRGMRDRGRGYYGDCEDGGGDCEGSGGRMGNMKYTDDDFFGYRRDPDMARSKRDRRDHHDDDLGNGYPPYDDGGYGDYGDDYDGGMYRNNRRSRNSYRRDGRRQRSPLADDMCSDGVDEIGKIICEINRMPNFIL